MWPAVLWDLTDGMGESLPRSHTNQDDIANLKLKVWDILDTPAVNRNTSINVKVNG